MRNDMDTSTGVALAVIIGLAIWIAAALIFF